MDHSTVAGVALEFCFHDSPKQVSFFVGGIAQEIEWSGREDLNLRPPAPKYWSHEKPTTCTECDEL